MRAQAIRGSGPWRRRFRNGHRPRVSRSAALLVAALALLAAWALAPQGRAVAAGYGSEQGVLPPPANPMGYSLSDMSRLTAEFTVSGNDALNYPNTPFQILYTNPSLVSYSYDCETFTGLCGLTMAASTGVSDISNSFTVKAGTMFYVPVLNADDSPPVVGVFPTTPSEARAYFFDPAQLGGKMMEIQIDSHTTVLDSQYVAGPVTTPPLSDGGGTHFVTIGAFLNPLTPGVHTVRIQGGWFGEQFRATYGVDFLWENLTYRVQVNG